MKRIFIMILFVLSLSTVYSTNISCIGDSITYGLGLNSEQKFCTMINNSNINYFTYNFGVSGYTTRSLLEHITEFKVGSYEYSTLMIGTNDMSVGVNALSMSGYYLNLKNIVERLNNTDNLIIGTIPPSNSTDRETTVNQQTVINRNNIVRYISYKYNLCYADIFSDSFNSVYDQSLYIDTLHPNEQGNVLMNITFNKQIDNCVSFNCSSSPKDCYRYTK